MEIVEILFPVLALLAGSRDLYSQSVKFRYKIVYLTLILWQPVIMGVVCFMLASHVGFPTDVRKKNSESNFEPKVEPPSRGPSSIGVWTLYPRGPNVHKLNKIGKEYKELVNDTPKPIFDRVKFYTVPFPPRDLQIPSRGYYKLKQIDDHMTSKGIIMKGTFIDLCAGAGGWSHYLVKDRKMLHGTAVSYWTQYATHEQWKGPSEIRTITGDISRIRPFKADWIFCDGGESMRNADQEEARHANLLKGVYKWLDENRDSGFVIKVLQPTGPGVRRILKDIQKVTRKGALIRPELSRLSTSECYFVSLPISDVDQDAYSIMSTLIDKWKYALVDTPANVTVRYASKVPEWQTPPKLEGVDPLEAYDYSEVIKELVGSRVFHPPRGLTSFLKEHGFYLCASKGSQGGKENAYVSKLLAVVKDKIPGLRLWKPTSTTPEATFRVVQEKIDKAPVEEHQHWDLIQKTYALMKEYMREKGYKLRYLTNEEVTLDANPQGTMGMQEATMEHEGLKYNFSSIKDYSMLKVGKKYLWNIKMESILRDLERGKPTKAIFETTAKKEKKQDTSRFKDRGSRLIWFLPATWRLHEQRVFGGLESILGRLPFTVSGRPLYDYGELIAECFAPGGMAAVADDVAGWDTRVSKGLQMLECDLLMSMAKDQEHKKYIRDLYRIYANPCLAVDRKMPTESEAETAVYTSQGQVASGRRPTYAMNTITNMLLTLISVTKSRNMSDEQALNWIRSKLYKGQDTDFSAFFSGDDKVVIMKMDKIRVYASKGYQFMNDLGMIRKDVALNDDSRVIVAVNDLEFCSNRYVEVNYRLNDGTVFRRWMPMRGADEIFGKAMMALKKAKNFETEEAWARVQGMNLLVNYHHLPEARALGLILMSVTNNRIMLMGLDEGWAYQSKPWMRDGDIVEIVSNCLFGDSTTIERCKIYRGVERINDLGQMSQTLRRTFCPMKKDVRRKWYKDMSALVHVMRKSTGTYDDWFVNMRPLVNGNYD